MAEKFSLSNLLKKFDITSYFTSNKTYDLAAPTPPMDPMAIAPKFCKKHGAPLTPKNVIAYHVNTGKEQIESIILSCNGGKNGSFSAHNAYQWMHHRLGRNKGVWLPLDEW